MRNPFRRRRSAGDDPVQPHPVDPSTLAGSRQVGNDGGSGQVNPTRAFTEPDAGGRVALLGRFVVEPSGQLDAIRTPESWYADRALYGGAAAFPAFGEFRDEPALTGGYQVITGRPPVIINDPVFVESPAVPSFREVPQPELCRRVPTIVAPGRAL